MKRALPLVLLAAGCSLRAPRVESAPCSNTVQCDQPSVCFLGECRPHSSSLTLVEAEIRPPNDSPLGAAQVGGIDLHQTAVQNFALKAPLAASGSVLQEQDLSAAPVAVAGAVITFTDHAPAIPDRVEQVTALVDASGNFSVRLPQGKWDVLVQPPAPLPPFRAPEPVDTAAPVLNFVVPRASSLTQVQGALVTDGGVLAGATVTAVDSAGNVISAPSSVQADGGFSLYLPPASTAYALQVGPPPDSDGGFAAALDPLPNYDRLTPAAVVDVPLPPVAQLHGTVRDAAGTPVANARVYARSDGMPWSLARSTSTATDGTWGMALRAGNYLVEAAPANATDAPAVSGELTATLDAAGAGLDIVCPPKVHGVGLVMRPNGAGAVSANYQITATRVADRLLTARTAATTATDTAGLWRILADPGRYRVEVVPSADSGYPRKVVQIEVDASTSEVTLPVITLSPPLVVGGVVGAAPDPTKGPAPNATVSFYSLDANGHGVLLGTTATDDKGQYKAVLPDVAQPSAAY